jgi:bacterioferritin (cytochrome b1)
MVLTPLYSAPELDVEISQAKLDLAAARRATLTQLDTSSISRRIQREQLKSLQDHLDWLQRQRAALQIGPGIQYQVGRPTR